jgi:hypothetical protein
MEKVIHFVLRGCLGKVSLIFICIWFYIYFIYSSLTPILIFIFISSPKHYLTEAAMLCFLQYLACAGPVNDHQQILANTTIPQGCFCFWATVSSLAKLT